MKEKQPVQDVPRGFANVIYQQIESLNNNTSFFQRYKNNPRTRFVLNPTNAKHAAVITLDQGKIAVEDVSNADPSNLDRQKLGWHGYVSCHTRVFMELALGKLSLLGMLKKVVRGEVQVKGITRLLKLKNMFMYLK